MRVYVPTTLPRLAAISAAGRIEPGTVAYAVTPALREWYVNGDIEELEYAAMADAARDSLRQIAAAIREAELSGGRAGPARRVVIAADVPDGDVQPLSAPIDDGSRAMVRVSAAVPIARMASVHVDDDEAEAAVSAAARAVSDADAGDEDAKFVVDAVEDHELLWYAVQEIPDLLRRFPG